MKFEKIENCSWNRTRKIREANKSAEKDTITKIRIPLLEMANVPKIDPGDYMIKGEFIRCDFSFNHIISGVYFWNVCHFQ